MVNGGVFAVARAVWDDPDFADSEFSKREAWIWLIGAAAWKCTTVRGTNGGVSLNRGEFCFSVRFLAERWKWSKSRVERMIIALKNRDTIRDTSRNGEKIYLISKYNDFQVVGIPKKEVVNDAERDSSGTAVGQQRDKEKEGKHGSSKLEMPASAGPSKSSAFSADFEKFWQSYPVRKNMSKKLALQEWAQLTAEKRLEAVAAVPGFLRYCGENKWYIPVYADGFLRQERFEGYTAENNKMPTPAEIEVSKDRADQLFRRGKYADG